MQNVECKIENDRNCLVAGDVKIENTNFVNIGVGEDISIKNLSEIVAKIVWFEGEIAWDTSKPNGTMRKLLNVSKINALWWKAKTSLEEGIKKSYEWFLGNG